MVLTPSTMLPLGTKAPDFSLVNVDGQTVSLADFAEAPALLVMFICNHCPYVKHLADALAEFATEYQAKGLAVVGINSNDVSSYPDDSPAQMKAEADRRGYRSRICLTRRKRWPRRTARPARPSSTCSTRTASSCTGASSIPADREAAHRSPARTSARPWTPCWRTSCPRPSSRRASAATSSGSRATSRITSASGWCSGVGDDPARFGAASTSRSIQLDLYPIDAGAICCACIEYRVCRAGMKIAGGSHVCHVFAPSSNPHLGWRCAGGCGAVVADGCVARGGRRVSHPDAGLRRRRGATGQRDDHAVSRRRGV